MMNNYDAIDKAIQKKILKFGKVNAYIDFKDYLSITFMLPRLISKKNLQRILDKYNKNLETFSIRVYWESSNSVGLEISHNKYKNYSSRLETEINIREVVE